jgi:restriction endonuclease
MKKQIANVQQIGGSYRVRVQKNGKRVSKSFTSQRKAIQFRNELRG